MNANERQVLEQLVLAADSGVWHDSADCAIERSANDCWLCEALARARDVLRAEPPPVAPHPGWGDALAVVLIQASGQAYICGSDASAAEKRQLRVILESNTPEGAALREQAEQLRAAAIERAEARQNGGA